MSGGGRRTPLIGLVALCFVGIALVVAATPGSTESLRERALVATAVLGTVAISGCVLLSRPPMGSAAPSRSATPDEQTVESRPIVASHAAASVNRYRLEIGQCLDGRYEVFGVLGHGAMGFVYRAHDRELGGDVALKTLRPELLADDPSLLERFKSEIRLTRMITHRNVVRTYEYGEAEGFFYVTMELVDGVSLREVLESRGRLTPAATLAIAQQLFGALAAAHAGGVIHRDIKPENLLLTDDGSLKVADFGIARLAAERSGITQVGAVVGTPAYMAPEQILEEPVDDRADVYAAGVVLFECATGRLPFEAKSPIAMIAKIFNEEPPMILSIVPTASPALSALMTRLLAKDCVDRPTAVMAEEEFLQLT